ncbi:MAG TPA: HK97 gp10 family phage protein, partial [Acidobacteriota bacterium]|nr:HK97 gp10 family phage protein [Acidobacteriota bacterium]
MNGCGSFSFELKGVKELTRLLDQLPTVAMKKTVLRNALKKAGNPIAEAAKANVPVVTGRLRDSIKVSTSLKPSQRKGRQDRSVVTVYVGASSPVAHLVEFGTVERTLDEPRPVKL